MDGRGENTIYTRSQVSARVGVPPSLLKSGPTQYLTEEENQELAAFLKQISRIGYGKTKREILAIVQKVVKSIGQLLVISTW